MTWLKNLFTWILDWLSGRQAAAQAQAAQDAAQVTIVTIEAHQATVEEAAAVEAAIKQKQDELKANADAQAQQPVNPANPFDISQWNKEGT